MTSQQINDEDSDRAGSELGEYAQYEPLDVEEAATWRHRAADLLDRPESSAAAVLVHYAILGMIVASVVLTMVETMPELRQHSREFLLMDSCFTLIFSVEFALRFWTAGTVAGFCLDFYTIVELLALLPGYVVLTLLVHSVSRQTSISVQEAADSLRNMRSIRALRLMRVFRVVRLTREWRHAQQIGLLMRVVHEVTDSGFYALLMLISFLMVVSSSLMYAFESFTCDDMEGSQHSIVDTVSSDCRAQWHFDSIPAAFWWSISTLTTVGYGDMTPRTIMGKIVGCFTCVAAVMTLSITAALLSIHLRGRWNQENARNRFHTQFAEVPAMANVQAETEELLCEFQRSLDALLAQAAQVALRADGTVAPLLKSINQRGASLRGGVSSYIYEALLEEMATRLRAPPAPAPAPLEVGGMREATLLLYEQPMAGPRVGRFATERLRNSKVAMRRGRFTRQGMPLLPLRLEDEAEAEAEEERRPLARSLTA